MLLMEVVILFQILFSRYKHALGPSLIIDIPNHQKKGGGSNTFLSIIQFFKDEMVGW